MTFQQQFGNKIVVTVAGLVLDSRGRLLLVKHCEDKRDGFWYGKWICPGGRLELGETLTEGLMREVKEETNLEAEISGKPIVLDRIAKESSGVKLHVLYLDYVCSVAGGTLRAGSDAAVARWFSPGDLLSNWDELHEDTRRLLNESRILGEGYSVTSGSQPVSENREPPRGRLR